MSEYYSNENIKKNNCTYEFVVGQRSNGKTYSYLDDILDDFINKNLPSVLIRRYDEMLTPKNISKLLNPFIDEIAFRTDGKYNNYVYENRQFKLCYVDDKNKVLYKSEPLLYTISLNNWENRKGADVGNLSMIMFDEIISKKGYIENEWTIFMNVLSTFLRDRTDTKIVLIGNPISKFCPYFEKFKINIHKIKQGTITIFKYGETSLAFEYCHEYKNTSKTNKKYFDFSDKTLDMIKKGYWEIDTYARPTNNYTANCETLYTLYINYNDKTVKYELMKHEDTDNMITFCSPSTIATALKSDCYIVTNDISLLLNHKKCVGDFPNNKAVNIMLNLMTIDKDFYATDETGDLFDNFYKQYKLK